MKRLLRRLLSVVGFAILLAPISGLADTSTDQIPVERRLAAGISYVNYDGQVLRFASLVSIKVTLETLSNGNVRLTFVSATGSTGTVNVYWANFGINVYDGAVPIGVPWDGMLNTEGGFVDR